MKKEDKVFSLFQDFWADRLKNFLDNPFTVTFEHLLSQGQIKKQVAVYLPGLRDGLKLLCRIAHENLCRAAILIRLFPRGQDEGGPSFG